MSFKDLDIKLSYISCGEENIAKSFLIPTLKQAKSYKRSVGFFSSGVFDPIIDGIVALARNGGKIELINPYNGLLLIPNLDSLFDKGYISFSDDGVIIISNKIDISEYDSLGINTKMSLRFVSEEHKVFLQYHRENIFIK